MRQRKGRPFPPGLEDKEKPFDGCPIVGGLVGSISCLSAMGLLSIYLVLLRTESLWLGDALEPGLMVIWYNQESQFPSSLE